MVEYLRNKKKAIGALIAAPVAWVFVKFGLDDLLGANLSDELEITIVTILTGIVVERLRPIFGEYTKTPKPLTEPTPKRRSAYLEH